MAVAATHLIVGGVADVLVAASLVAVHNLVVVAFEAAAASFGAVQAPVASLGPVEAAAASLGPVEAAAASFWDVEAVGCDTDGASDAVGVGSVAFVGIAVPAASENAVVRFATDQLLLPVSA